MKVTSLRYLDAKFHHPSLRASPPLRRTVFACLQNCYNSCISCSRSALRYDSINSNLMNYSWTNGRLAIPSTSWASCWRMVHCTNRQKHSKPLVYKSSQVYRDCTNSVPTVCQSSKTVKTQSKHSQNSTKMTTGVPVVTCLPRLYQPYTNSVPKQSKDRQNSKNDHWCINRHRSIKTVPTV